QGGDGGGTVEDGVLGMYVKMSELRHTGACLLRQNKDTYLSRNGLMFVRLFGPVRPCAVSELLISLFGRVMVLPERRECKTAGTECRFLPSACRYCRLFRRDDEYAVHAGWSVDDTV